MKKKILILLLVSLAVGLVFATAPLTYGNKTGKPELSAATFKNLTQSGEKNNIRSCHRLENRQKEFNRYSLDNAFGRSRSFENKKNKKH